MEDGSAARQSSSTTYAIMVSFLFFNISYLLHLFHKKRMRIPRARPPRTMVVADHKYVFW
ncbi:hypothetical protein HanPSC8_Chr13g0566001 [Helianthus annuus]|nr:hypothetical protein HanPSC8_Chr13g0566001 [Helianthus annuus]